MTRDTASTPWIPRTCWWLALGLVVALPRPAWGDLGLQFSQLPLSKAFEQPFFSLDGSHVELLSLLFLFLATVVTMTVRWRRQAIRHLVQLVSLVVFFYLVFSCLGVFGMIRNTLHGISLIGTIYTESFFWMSLPVCVLAFSLVTGPFFCGWICPTGTIQELVAIVREAVSRRRQLQLGGVSLALMTALAAGFLYLVFSVSQQRQLFVEDSSLYWASSSILLPLLVMSGLASDRATRKLRWFSLGTILGSSLFKVVITSPVHFAFVDVVDPASAITTLVLAVSSLFIARSWCRYLCPWGQLMALTHRVSRLRFVIDQRDCKRCGACESVCRIGAITVGEGGRPASDSGSRPVASIDVDACQFCFACLDACPRGSIQLVDRWHRACPATEPA